MTAHRNGMFRNTKLVLDGDSFDNCEFFNCELIYKGGELPVLTNNRFEQCKWSFEGAASRTVQFMTALYAGGGRELIEATLNNIRGNPGAGVRH